MCIVYIKRKEKNGGSLVTIFVLSAAYRHIYDAYIQHTLQAVHLHIHIYPHNRPTNTKSSFKIRILLQNQRFPLAQSTY